MNRTGRQLEESQFVAISPGTLLCTRAASRARSRGLTSSWLILAPRPTATGPLRNACH